MAGLKFYLCQTPTGPQYVHLQIDAKKLDPNYQIVEIDTSKQALMDRLNELLRAAGQVPAPLGEGEEEVIERTPPSPPSPLRSAKATEMMGRTYDQIGFEEFIWSIPDDEIKRLDTLERIIHERRREITHPGEIVADTQPARTGRKWGNK